MERFETLISDLLPSNDNERRGKARKLFHLLKQRVPNMVANKLFDLLASNPQDVHIRALCVFLIKIAFFMDEEGGRIWCGLDELTQSRAKSVILNCIKCEELNSIIHELRSIVLALADNNWPELLPFLNECVNSNSIRLIESFFVIFVRLKNDLSETFVPHINIPHSVFLYDVTGSSVKVRIAVLITAIKYIRSLNKKEWFQNLLPVMMSTLIDALSNGEEVLGRYLLQRLIDLGKNEPRFLRTQLVDVVNTMLEIAESTSFVKEARYLAIEFVLTLVEARDKAPGMLRKVPLFTNTWFAFFLSLLLDIKDEPNWHCGQSQHDGFFRYAQMGLQRFSIALGGKTVASIAIEQLSAYSVASEWEKRHAALIALASIAEGSSKVMIKYLEGLMDMVLHSFEDPHPRVRWAAIHAICQLSTHFRPDLQKQYRSQVLPALATAMDDCQSPRVQALAAEGVVKFCRSEKPETFVPFLDVIVNKLHMLVQNDNQMVQEAALSALGAVADFSMGNFQKYYDLVTPYLKTIAVNANDKFDHVCQSKALQCISYVGMAVGKEKFRDDLKQVMEVLMSLQESQEKGFITVDYIIKAWSRICGLLGKDFLPYASTVMPLLVEYAQLEPDKTVPMDELKVSIHKVKFGDAIICARGRDLLRAKYMGCFMLHVMALVLEEDFYPWISQAASVLAPLLKFYVCSDVREKASAALLSLLCSAKLAAEKEIGQCGKVSYFKQLAVDIILAMGDALYSEPQTEVCAFILSELNNCLENCGPLLDEDQVRSIIDVIKLVITQSSGRKRELTERAKSEDFDAEEAELLMDEREREVEISSNVASILITLIKTFKVAFLPFLDELLSYLMPMTGKDKAAAEKSKCICIFVELVEHCGEAALTYYNIYLPFLLDSSNDENPVVRQNALYGLGLCAKYGGYVFKPHAGEACRRINVVITHLHACEPENEHAYANAVSALGKICQFHRESIDSAQVIPAWLNCLPVKADFIEAQLVHEQLCSLIERFGGELLGPNYQYFPKVVSVFAKVLCYRRNYKSDD